jgi:hypothetical protein
MSLLALNWAVSVSVPLTRTERIVLMALAFFHNTEKGCFPSQKRLLKQTGLKSQPNLSLVLHRLQRKRLLTIQVRKSKFGRRNTYQLHTAPHKSQGGLYAYTNDPSYVYTNDGEGGLYGTQDIEGEKIKRREREKRLYGARLKANAKEGIPETGKASGKEGEGEGGKISPPVFSLSRAIELQSSEPSSMSKPPLPSADILAQWVPKSPETIYKEARAKETPDGGGVPPRVLWAAWRDFCAVYRPGYFVGEPTVKLLSQLKQAQTIAGRELLGAMDACIHHWQQFLIYAQDRGAWVQGSLPEPHVGFFLKHVETGVNFSRYMAQQSLPARAVAGLKANKPLDLPSKPLTNVADILKDPHHVPATLEEVLAIFGEK